jgi:hypothetical protein
MSKKQKPSNHPKNQLEKSEVPQISIPIEDSKLIYCNLALVQILSEEEIILTIVSSNISAVRAAFHPKHAKRLLLLLEQQIALYENHFGTLEVNLGDGPKSINQPS